MRVRRNRNRNRTPTAGSPRGRLAARVVTLNAALLQSPKAKRCGGGTQEPGDRGEGNGALQRRAPAQDADPASAAAVRAPPGRRQGLPRDGDGGHGRLGRHREARPPDEEHVLRHPRGRERRRRREQREGLHDPGRRAVSRSRSSRWTRPRRPRSRRSTRSSSRRSRSAARPTTRRRSSRPRPSMAARSGAMRDIATGAVSAAGGQYQPKSNKLKVFTSMDVTVNFGGDNKGTFGGSDLLSPWNHAFVERLRDARQLSRRCVDRLRPIRPVFCGEELLIITSSDLRPAAEHPRGAAHRPGLRDQRARGRRGTGPDRDHARRRSRPSSAAG